MLHKKGLLLRTRRIGRRYTQARSRRLLQRVIGA